MGVRYVADGTGCRINESFLANWNKPIQKNSGPSSMKFGAVGEHAVIRKKSFLLKSLEPCLGNRTNLIYDIWLTNELVKLEHGILVV